MSLQRLALGMFLLGQIGGAGWVLAPSMLAGSQSAPPVARQPATQEGQPAPPSPSPPAAPPVAALFLGNSYVHGNAMPGMIAGLAEADGQAPFEHVIDAPGGFSLEDHMNSRRYQQHLASRKFDFVILQEQSQRPSFRATQRARQMAVPGHVLYDASHYSGAKTLLFMTWARRDGDPQNEVGDTYADMQERVAVGYRDLGAELGAQVVPVGLVWRDLRSARPDLPLWMPDGSHPTLAGSYLAACVFYTAMYDRPVGGLAYDAGVEPELAGLLRAHVDRSPHSRTTSTTNPKAADAGAGVPLDVLPGIVTRSGDTCPQGYLPVEELCYHSKLRQDAKARIRLTTAYRAGAIPPLVQVD